MKPIVPEKSDAIGGISRTVRYKGNRIDIGGHRSSSKSKRVMNRWMDVMPVEGAVTRCMRSPGAADTVRRCGVKLGMVRTAKLGPGQLCEYVAEDVAALAGARCRAFSLT